MGLAVPELPKKRDNLSFFHLVPNLPSVHRGENLTLPEVVPLNSTRAVGLKDHLWEEVLPGCQAKDADTKGQSIRHKTHGEIMKVR